MVLAYIYPSPNRRNANATGPDWPMCLKLLCTYIAIADRATFASLPSLADGDADAELRTAMGQKPVFQRGRRLYRRRSRLRIC